METRGGMKMQLETSLDTSPPSPHIAAVGYADAWEMFMTQALADKYKKREGVGVGESRALCRWGCTIPCKIPVSPQFG